MAASSHARESATEDEEEDAATKGNGSGCDGRGLVVDVTAETTAVSEGGSGEESPAAGGRRPSHVVMVKRGKLARCLTCPICHKLFRDATTISECLHTFCRKCIYDKLTEEEFECCPVCKIDLGVVPVEKLRPDHSLQDLRVKIFPFKRRKVEAPEAPPIVLPVRRKERSLSSLVVNSPRVAAQTGRRTKGVARRGLRGSSPVINDSNKKNDSNIDKLAENSIAHDKLPPNRRQNSSNAEPSYNTVNKDSENGKESLQDKTELWKPLTCLVEVANRTKPFKSSPQDSIIKAEQTGGPGNDGISSRTRVKEHANKSKFQDEKNDSAQSPPFTGKAKRFQGRKRRETTTSAQGLADVANSQHDRRMGPIWFSLVAAFDQTGDPPLPQISTNYLRIKDGNLPVSFIQKYLVAKLNLVSDTEVEVMCGGQPVSPTMPLHNVVDQWLRGGPSQKLQTAIGMSAKDFVMVLAYGRSKPSAE